MADLLIELWHSIFDRLTLVDLASCAQACRRFYFTVKQYRIKELAFCVRVHLLFQNAPSFAYHKHQVDFTKSSILKRSSFNFDHLKRLKIGRSSPIDLTAINQLFQLEELDIDLEIYKNQENWTLSLANLKVLYVLMSDRITYQELKLNTPALTKVCTNSLKNLEFIYPESVQCIQTFHHGGKLSLFSNLDRLIFTDHWSSFWAYSTYESFEESSLASLMGLKEIHFYYHGFSFAKNLSNLKRTIQKILDLMRPGLKLFWMNVRVINSDLLTEYENMIENVGSRVAFQLKHYENLDKAEFFWSYDFNESMNLLLKAGFNPKNKNFQSKFLAQYSSLKRIKINGPIKERDLLIELITRSQNLSSLWFSKSDLGQSFFDKISEIIRLKGIPLQVLRFNRSPNDLLNFEFVFKFPDLVLFEIDQKLSTEFVSRLFDRLPMLTEIDFLSNQIERMSTNRFCLNKQSLSLAELLEDLGSQPVKARRESSSSD